MAPVAVDDHYEVNLGQTLTVPASGVLDNDLSRSGQTLDRGQVDRSGQGQPDRLQRGRLVHLSGAGVHRQDLPACGEVDQRRRFVADIMLRANNLLAVDVDGDGKPELVTNDAGQGAGAGWGVYGISALRGTDGSLLWGTQGVWLPPAQTGPPAYAGPAPYYCSVMNRSNPPDTMAVGDIDDSGTPSIIVPLQCPGGPNTWPTPPAPPSFRLGAFDTKTGAMKWLSEDLGFLHNGATTNQLTWNIVPAIARLAAGETPTILFKKTLAGNWGSGPDDTWCNDYQPGTGAECTVVIGIDGATGARRRTWVAPIDYYSTAWGDVGGYVVVADLTGSGSPNIVADRSVWDVNGTLLSNRMNGRMVVGLALANLDDSGQTAIISHELAITGGYVVARKPDGSVLWETPTDATAGSVSGEIVVADLYGDGMPKVLVTTNGNLYVYDERGSLVWTHRFADAANYPTIANWVRPVVFDLDGDGVPELIMQTNTDVQFFDGRTGTLKAKLNYHTDLGYPAQQAYGYGYLTPIVVDLDGDGHAEVVFNIVSPYYGVPSWAVALKSVNDDWQPARPVWNQFAMHDANVTDTGHIPGPEVNNFVTPRTNVFANPARIAPPVDPRKREQATFTYKAQAGELDSNPATVTIDLVPPNRPPVFTSTPPTTYIAYNNSYPAIVPFLYQAHAVDPDPGDTVTYSIVTKGGSLAYQFTFDPITGKLECKPLIVGSNSGPIMFVIAATDSFGASAYQTFTLYPSAGFATVPNVVGLSKTTAAATLAAAGFATGTINAIYHPAPVDQVLSQYPVAGTSLLAGEAVALQISQGLQPQPVPDLIGLSLADARARLLGFGFTVNINPVASPTAPANMVLAQNPAFGTMLAPGNPVTLDVSIGPPLSGTVAQVIVEPAPSAMRLVGETLDYRATAVFTDGTSRDVTIASLWNSLPSSVASVDSTGAAKGLTPGTTTIRATVNGVTGQSTLSIVSRVPGDAVTPVAQITAPTDGASVTGLVTVTGTASDANFLRYELSYALAGDATWTTIAEGTSAVTAGPLGTLDPTTLVNDLYTLRLAVFDRNGNETDAMVTVQVIGNVKPGLFTLTYQDLNIPMTGIPITVTRTYDSRDKTQGDFGVGWRQGFNTLRLRTNRVPGTGWVRNLGSLGVVSLTPTSEHKVSITLPDGKVEVFDLVLSPTSGFGGLDFTAVSGYAPRPGTLGQLQALGNLNLLILNGGAEDELVDDLTLNTFNPKLYRYTTADGTQIDIDITDGVKKITDRNGNNVTFGPAGVIHSSGKSVIFIRDGQGRITQITDPMGNVQTYAYDLNGDLISHTSVTGNTSRYVYDRRHNMIDMQDPAGNHAARNDYDVQGRLIATTDGKGNKITYTHNIGASTELVTDRLGNVTLYTYDTMGNVTAKTNALGNLWTYTYDSRNNQLTQTDPLGRLAAKTYDSRNNVLSSTDFEGNTTTYTYNSFGQVLTKLDPEAHLTTNVYDSNGNLTQVTDPEGGMTRHTYDAAGNRLTTTDALGRVKTFTYDSAGDVTSKTDPLGYTTTYVPDLNGKLQSTTDAAGKTTRFTYDADGHCVTLTDPLGNVTSLNYSNTGLGTKLSRWTNAAGNVTNLVYDVMDNKIQTTYPDGSTATFTYDAESRKTGITDPDGRALLGEYDALGRVTKETLPGGATLRVSYDAAGRVVTATDPRGNAKAISYAPNKETLADALGNVVVNEFDSQHRRVKVTDALGHVTSLTYDSAGNLIKTTFPDGTFKTTTYNAAKQKIADTDQAGKTTQFAYDAAGRLIRVTDTLGGITFYTYDAVGNRLTQTDANGHTTQMTYDAMGRIVSRTKPSGRQETFVYDARGNLVSHTDFNGQTTTFSYDTQRRLTQKRFPDGSSVAYTYTAAGLRTQAGGDNYVYNTAGLLSQEHKASGEALSYTYDAAGNRTSLTTPQGTTLYTFDQLNRLKTVVDAAGTTNYGYDAAGKKMSTTYPNGITTTYSYDSLGRLLQVANTEPGGMISSYTYTLGPAGNRTRVVEAGSATTNRTVVYTYDALYRLTEEQIAEPGSATETMMYVLDAVGNRTQMTRNGVVTSYTYDSSNRLMTDTTGGITRAYSYDDNGNLLGRASGAVTETYKYDTENRLISSTVPAGTYTYGYDADGMRTGRTAAGVITAFLLDKNGDFAQVLTETTGANTLTYTYGDRLISQQQSGGGTHYYLADGQQSTRQLATAAGVVSDSYTYDAFGVLLASTGTTANAYRYAGEQADPGTGNYYLRARYLEPDTGRFLTTDPESGNIADPLSMQGYLYGKGSPIDNRDPSGRLELSEVLVVMGIVVALYGAYGYLYAHEAKKQAREQVHSEFNMYRNRVNRKDLFPYADTMVGDFREAEREEFYWQSQEDYYSNVFWGGLALSSAGVLVGWVVYEYAGSLTVGEILMKFPVDPYEWFLYP